MPSEHNIAVLLGPVAGPERNTVELERSDLVIPLARDLDDDPYQDDEVVLRDMDGREVLRLLSSDANVTPDEASDLLLYRFTSVAYGAYSVHVVVGGYETMVIPQILVRASGIFIGDKKLPEALAATEAEVFELEDVPHELPETHACDGEDAGEDWS